VAKINTYVMMDLVQVINHNVTKQTDVHKKHH